MKTTRAHWAAIGAAVAVSVGAGGFGVARAVVDEGPKPIFVPITPCRIMDTRTAGDFNTGPRATPLGPNETYVVSATDPARNGDCGAVIPPEAVGLVLNVTITDPTQNTFVTIFPTGEALPDASNLNALAGKLEPTPNLVTTDLSADGQFSVYNLNGTTNVLADVAGYYEDHNHDDRYLTEDEVNALFGTAAARNAFATTNPDGTLIAGTDGITLVRNGDGSYTFTVAQGTLPEGLTLADCAITSTTDNPEDFDLLNPDLQVDVDRNLDGLSFDVNVTDLFDAQTDSGLSTTIICGDAVINLTP